MDEFYGETALAYNRHYIITDARNCIIDAWSDGPHPERDTSNAICINKEGSYQFQLYPGGKKNPPLYTMDGISLYHWDGEQVVARTEDEIAVDREAKRQEMESEQAAEQAKSEVGKTLLLALAQEVPPKVAAKVNSIYNKWRPGVKYGYDGCEKYVQCDIPGTGGAFGTSSQLYRCVQSHISQEGWEPYKTQALWVSVDDEHDGTTNDPIPAARGMEYQYGLYYMDPEDHTLYLCKRGSGSGTIVLQYLPHELIGHYFEVVS